MRVQQDIRSIEVFESFALVVFEDETVLLAVRPATLGEYASYNQNIVDVGSLKRAQLDYTSTPIEYHSMVADNTFTYDYVLSILSTNSANE